jgi:hypothetical protein
VLVGNKNANEVINRGAVRGQRHYQSLDVQDAVINELVEMPLQRRQPCVCDVREMAGAQFGPAPIATLVKEFAGQIETDKARRLGAMDPILKPRGITANLQ